MPGAVDISRRGFLSGRFLRRTEQLDRPAEPAARPSVGRTEPSPAPAHPTLRLLPLLRPPGAVSEELFLARCTKCESCVEACPHGAIVKTPVRLGPAGDTPVIAPERAPCLLCADRPCVTACETGALLEELPPKMGTARVDPTTCLAHQGSFCSTCSERCPVPGAITVQHGRPRIDATACVGCGVCAHACPAPFPAIALMPTPDRPMPRENA